MIQTFKSVRKVAALAAASLCLAVMSCGGPKANTLSQQEIADGWHLLFNGEDLTGWEVCGSEIWYVDEDGVLLGESSEEGGFGYLATVEYYNDFEISLDFKQVNPSNSGLFFRSRIDYDSPSLIFGLECDILPFEENNTAGICEVGGRGLLTPISGEKTEVMNIGDWNTLKLRVEGEHIQTWLNGEQMVDLTDEELDVQKGRIALQVHDGGGIKIAWRNIKIKTL